MPASVLWFRRDLRLSDHPALLAARDAGEPVVPLFVLDDRLRRPSGAPRLAFLYRTLRELDEALSGRLVVRHGRPEEVVPAVVGEVGAGSVHVSADFGPYGRERDDRVERALGAVPLVRTGSPYAVAPGRVRRGGRDPYRVFTPFFRAWKEHGWRDPAIRPRSLPWAHGVPSDGVPADPDLDGTTLPPAGEAAALARWRAFRDGPSREYGVRRNQPGVDGTSRLSVYLKYGCVHPRTLLADLSGRSDRGAESFRSELAWREFYADVLWQRPDTAREYLQPGLARMRFDDERTASGRLRAWQEGRTGYPIVDAGMRQLRAEAWMHNRVRMITASFLVKDLHLEWTVGARWFMQHLVDGDLASNNHGWQWVAGTGTDPAPYFRVFNPVLQGRKFDPSGDYVRRYVPELRGVEGEAVHEPWTLPGGVPGGYPEPVVDHAAERREALARLAEVRP